MGDFRPQTVKIATVVPFTGVLGVGQFMMYGWSSKFGWLQVAALLACSVAATVLDTQVNMALLNRWFEEESLPGGFVASLVVTATLSLLQVVLYCIGISIVWRAFRTSLPSV